MRVPKTPASVALLLENTATVGPTDSISPGNLPRIELAESNVLAAVCVALDASTPAVETAVRLSTTLLSFGVVGGSRGTVALQPGPFIPGPLFMGPVQEVVSGQGLIGAPRLGLPEPTQPLRIGVNEPPLRLKGPSADVTPPALRQPTVQEPLTELNSAGNPKVSLGSLGDEPTPPKPVKFREMALLKKWGWVRSK
jgi:hypothetical protein